MINLKEWSQNNDILGETLKHFWHCFDVYREEDREEFVTIFPKHKENIILKFDRISYEMDLPDFLQELIAVYIDIYVDEIQVGWFKQLYSLDGEPFDEYFVIE